MTSVQERIEQSIKGCYRCMQEHEGESPGSRLPWSVLRGYNRFWAGPPMRRVCSVHALQRSWSILWDHLTPNQRYTLWYAGGFVTRRSPQHRLWLITIRPSSGLYRFDRTGQYRDLVACVILRGEAPLGDHLLAQKLWLEYDPNYLTQVAACNRRQRGDLSTPIDLVTLEGVRVLFEAPAQLELTEQESAYVRANQWLYEPSSPTRDSHE